MLGIHTPNGGLDVDIILLPIGPFQLNNLVYRFGLKYSRQIGSSEMASIVSQTKISMLFIK